jgi:hypothetical protein
VGGTYVDESGVESAWSGSGGTPPLLSLFFFFFVSLSYTHIHTQSNKQNKFSQQEVSVQYFKDQHTKTRVVWWKTT